MQPIERRLDSSPVAVVFRLSKTSASQGEEFEATVELEVAPFWEIHALDAQPAETATQIELVVQEEIAEATAWKAPAAQQSMFPGRGLTYAGTITFVKTLSVAPTAGVGTVDVGCRVRFQACNDRQCLRPDEITLSVPLAVNQN